MDNTCDLILDIATDSTESTRDQLVTVVKNKINESDKHNIIVLTKGLDPQNGFEESTFPNGKLVVSNDYLDLLFKAKCDLDNAGVKTFQLVTTLPLKKYWERVCYHMFSPIHEWSVLGIDVTGQAVDLFVPKEEEVEANFKEYLKTIGNPEEVVVLRSKVIPEDMFNAGFHQRYGGVSQLAPIASLNMLYTIRKVDSWPVIIENRRRLAKAAGFDLGTFHPAKVEHDKVIWVVGKEAPVKYDGLVTNVPGVTIAAPGADCSMILLADTKTGACGAVHAGWRGTVVGAVRSCLQTMVKEFGTDPKDIHAAIGPTIEASCFDLPGSDASVLSELDPSLLTPSTITKGWVHADLVRANKIMLEKDGVYSKNIDTTHAVCTSCNKEFFSHRRDAIPFGNQIGFISCRVKKQ